MQLEIRIRAELGVHAEVMQTGAREELSEHGGHAADTELNGRPVADVRQEQVCDRGVLRARRVLGRIGKRRVRALDDHVRIGDMDDLVKAAAQPRQTLVDLQNDDVRLLEDRAGHAGRRREVEVPVAIHRRDARHGDVHREKLPVIPREVAEDHRREVAQAAVAEPALIRRAMPCVVEKMRLLRVALDDLQRAHAEIAAHLHVMQLVTPGGKRRIEQRRKAERGRIVHPVAVLHGAHRLGGRAQLAAVFGLIVHRRSS